MPTPTHPRYPRTPVYVDAAPRKSLLLSAILTFFFGPLGMIYTTFLGTIVMTGLTLVVAVLTLAVAGLAWRTGVRHYTSTGS